MFGLTTQIAVHMALVLPGAVDYSDAYAATLRDRRPLLVLIGADWCPGCRVMKQRNMPALRQTGGLRGLHYAEVNVDRQSDLAHELMEGGTIPQLILFTRAGKEWDRRQLTGVYSPDRVRQFIRQATRTSGGP